MSLDSLISATVSRLRSALSLTSANCDEAAGDEGQPPPFVGQVFYAVHEGQWNNDAMECLDEFYGLSVTISLRAAVYPLDRLKTARSALRGYAANVRKHVHMSYTIMNAANVILGNSVNGFIEPLTFLDGGRSVLRAGTWFGADVDEAAGLSRTLTFGRARRIQTLESMA